MSNVRRHNGAPLSSQADQILSRVDDTLATVRQGFNDLCSADKSRRMTGLRNLLVFGRSVTFVLQNLRSVNQPEFDAWYQVEKRELQGNALARYFVEARNELEKQGKLSVGTRTFIKSFTNEDIRKFGPPPANAKSFFIGDNLGGAGWAVDLGGGQTAKYYVELPQSIGTVTQHFTNLPAADPALSGSTIEELCGRYMNLLTELVERAHARFGSSPRKQTGVPLLRRIK